MEDSVTQQKILAHSEEQRPSATDYPAIVDRWSSVAWIIGGLITLLAALLRLYGLNVNGLNTDEIWSVWMASHPTLEIVRMIVQDQADATPPIYYALLRAMLNLGDSLLVIRAITILAGTLIVWLTFRLGMRLFDLRIAALAALLVAIAPLHVSYSLVARSYLLADLLVLVALFLLAEIVFGEPRRRHWIGLVLSLAVAMYTFYLSALIVLFANGVIAWLWRRLTPAIRRNWLISQAALVVVILPLLATMLFVLMSDGQPNGRQGWLGRPGPQAIVKSIILFGTGDPSSGPAGLTPARMLSLAVLLAIVALVVWTLFRVHSRQNNHPSGSTVERSRVFFLAAAALAPWAFALIISQVRPIYHEKYLLFIIPPLALVIAWAVIRSRHTLIAGALVLALLGLNVRGLTVYYNEPTEEQWREASAALQTSYQPGDMIIIAPGFYSRSLSYYFQGRLLEQAEILDPLPATIYHQGIFQPLTTLPPHTTERQIWLVTGYTPVDPQLIASIEREYSLVDSQQFVGVTVRRLR